MKKHLFIILSSILLTACGGDLGNDKCHISYEVVEVGQCGGGEGFFSGNRECPIKIKKGNAVSFSKVYDGAMTGQTVYKECWSEDDGRHCFATTRTNLRNLYEKVCD